MADIRVEQKRGGLGWLWVLIALILIALLVWWFVGDDEAEIDEPLVTEPGVTLHTPDIASQIRFVA